MRKFNLVLVTLAILGISCSHAARKVVCYYGTWATYRHGNGQFNVNDIDPNLCTHLIYTFFGITQDATMRILDPYLDLADNYGRGNIQKFNSLKKQNPQLKTMAAIGGWNEGSGTFSAVASSYAKRLKFAQNVAKFCKIYNFDGIDIDWEYPARRDGNAAFDRENFVLLLEELRRELESANLLLSAAVSSAEQSASISYDIARVSRSLDFINIMAYDLHGPWDLQIDHNAPLYEGANDVTPLQKQLNVNASILYWLSQGASREKLILGIPLYGRTFTLRNPAQNTVGSSHSGPGLGGQYTNEPGMIGYNELCEKQMTNHWPRQWDRLANVPYRFSGNQWISYDDVESVALKVRYAVEQQLGGAMVWSIETDDFHGICQQGKYPLLNTINRVLNGGGNIPTTTVRPPANTDLPSSPTTTRPPITESTPNWTTISTPPTPSTPSSNSSTIPPTTTPPSHNNCTSDGYFRDPSDCSSFYICDNHVAYLFKCPTPLLYDETINTCNWPAAVIC